MPPSGACSAEERRGSDGDRRQRGEASPGPGFFSQVRPHAAAQKGSKTRRHPPPHQAIGRERKRKAQRCDVPIKIAPDYSEIRCRNEDEGYDAGSGLNQQSWQVRGEGGKGKERGGVCVPAETTLADSRGTWTGAAGTPTNGMDGSLSEPKRKSGPGVQPS
jgi:hypothetical protein